MHSTHNEGKSVVAERFIKTLKNKIYKHMTSISKMCILINQMIQLMNTTKKEFRIEKVIGKKGNKLYVKWKGYENLFNSWIDKNYVI